MCGEGGDDMGRVSDTSYVNGTFVVQCIHDESELFEEVDIVLWTECIKKHHWVNGFHSHSLCNAVVDSFNVDGGVKGEG